MSPQDAQAALATAAEAGDGILDIAQTALALSVLANPERPVADALAHLAELEQRVRAEPAASPSEVLEAVLHRAFGYDGNREDYEDLANADLAAVIERRRGLPVALAILYCHTARAAGWRATGLGYPAHFLVRVDGPGGAAILDPFHGGRRLEAQDIRRLLQNFGAEDALRADRDWAVSDRDMLLRLENNIRLRLSQAGDVEGALAVLGRMRLLAPDKAGLAADEAATLAQAGAYKGAVACLRGFLAGPHGDPRERREIENLLSRVESRLN